MRKITSVMLVLCMIAVLFAAVSCGDKQYEDFEETPEVTAGALDLDTQDGAVTAPPAEDSEGDSYIAAAPANDEQGWGALTPRPGK